MVVMQVELFVCLKRGAIGVMIRPLLQCSKTKVLQTNSSGKCPAPRALSFLKMLPPEQYS